MNIDNIDEAARLKGLYETASGNAEVFGQLIDNYPFVSMEIRVKWQAEHHAGSLLTDTKSLDKSEAVAILQILKDRWLAIAESYKAEIEAL